MFQERGEETTMTQGNGSTTSCKERIQAAADLLGSHQGLQPALHSLPRYGDRADVAQRSAHQAKRSTSSPRSPTSEIPSSCSAAVNRSTAPTFSSWPSTPPAAACAPRWPPTVRSSPKMLRRRSRNPASSASRSRSTEPMPPRTTAFAAFRAHSRLPFTA